ncbi:hypothetical protein [Enhygromyxa salina]|uniref:Uncharacterized protein n=1 Tax=Enhygromyxa salina TaxID=215803 RepID=A0A2S9YFE1_9BACT|nr:hypothetical protein [Enhygromyxa salina]PRQ03824.1 hypothetical protein ENSA7_52910 [Enhygromyxa salina]
MLASTFALAGSTGCKQETAEVPANEYPQRMAAGYCNAVFGCQCPSYPYANANECFVDLITAYDEVNDEAYLAGLRYDGTCPAAELDGIDSLACRASQPALPAGVCVAPCFPWHGNLTAGFPCEIAASSAELGLAFSNCAQGLVCSNSVCMNPCQSAGPLPGIGQPCPDLACAAGAMCDETMTCVAAVPLPGPGQACADGVCDPRNSVCVASANTCAALPGVGQLCVEGQCNADAYCGNDNVCLARPALACSLLGAPVNPGDGDGDGDPTTGDGDGDPTTGDGDGDTGGATCATEALPNSLPVSYGGDTSSGVDEFEGSCVSGSPGAPEAKLSFVAPASGVYSISTEGSTFETVVYVQDAACSGSDLACDYGYVEVSLSAGEEVTIFVDGYETGGIYFLQINSL